MKDNNRIHYPAVGAVLFCLGMTAILVALASADAAAGDRPRLEARHGRYFSWAAPKGWRSSETISGVDIVSPDKTSLVTFALLMRSQGAMTPNDFLAVTLRRLPGYGNFRVISTRGLPDQPSGIPGTYWKVVETEFSYTVGNMPVRGIWTCGINAYYGMYDASLTGFQAPQGRWPVAKFYLSDMARAIKVTNPRQVAGNDAIIPARNNPLDNSGVIASGRLRDESMDRISKGRREGNTGYERVKDPSTGEVYTMPLNNYDPTIGGYRNPKRPGEALVPTRPGE